MKICETLFRDMNMCGFYFSGMQKRILLVQSALLGRVLGLLSAIKKTFHLVVCEHHKVIYLFQVNPCSSCGLFSLEQNQFSLNACAIS